MWNFGERSASAKRERERDRNSSTPAHLRKELNAMTSSQDTAGGCSASCSTTVSYPLANVLMSIKEYDGLIKFIKQSSDPVKCELVQFLYPLYVYIYLLLLKRKRILEARKFISTYSQLFLNAEGYKNVIEDMFKFKNYREPKKHSYFKNFYVNKYVIKASEDNLKLLEGYLEGAKYESLFTIIRSQFQVEVVGKENDYNADSVNIHNEKDSVNELSEILEPSKCHSSRNADSVNIDNDKDSINESSETLKRRKCSSRKADSVNIDNDKDSINESSETLKCRKCSSRKADSVNIDNDKDSINESSETLKHRKCRSSRNADSVNINNDKDSINESSETLKHRKCRSSRKAESVNIANEKDSVNKSSETWEDKKFHSSENEDSRGACNESQRELCNRFYTISCGEVNVCSADIDKDNKFLACGFENSKIYVWNIESNSTDISKPTKRRRRRTKMNQKIKESELDDERIVQEFSAE
ncbi:hypothetical protein TNCV_1680331 [Trichonephila clavipes]|nr:hypothetical protein TNCV_1680331 [Trichonephila clavipes]